MGRRKKTDPPVEEKIPTFIVLEFADGPKEGKEIRLVNPPPAQVRLAFPEWCTYEVRGNKLYYIGDVEIDTGIRY